MPIDIENEHKNSILHRSKKIIISFLSIIILLGDFRGR